RRLVELAGAPRSFGRHPALPVLRAALVDDDRNALATALQRLEPHLRAAARLGDEAARERLFARARSSGQPDAPRDALVAADAVWWSLLSSCDSAPVSAWARARHDPLDVPPSVPAAAEAAVREAHRAALERAMVRGDRWPRSALHRAARHPVLGPLLAGVVFGCYGVQGLTKWFLLDHGGTAVDGFGTRVELVGRVGVVHPLALSDRERRELADRFDGQQPIEQLRRAVYVPMPDGRPDPAVVGGAMVPARVLALLERGWQRVGDGDVLRGVAKPIAPGLEVAIELAGVPREELAGFARAAQTMGTLVLGESGSRDASGYLQRHASWAALDPIGFSEIIREAAACLVWARVAPTWIDPVLAGIHRDAMRRAPGDEQAVFAWAELLRKHHHPEGELIELDLRERQGRLDDPIALERLLELAGLLGFPRLPDDPDEDLLAFRPQGGTSYALALGGRVHRIAYEGGVLTIEDGRARRVLRPRLSSPDRWTDEETNVILATALTNFREQRGLEALWLPGHEAFVGHPRHRVGPWPLYPFPAGVRAPAADAGAAVGVRARDRPRWTQLWHKLQVMLGDRPTQRL
ncbi:MAG: DUF4132 domain-containing protein, partial [Nannocystaceae bacterium]|nr:DUF4132 domain-containing protein [Nannocystaceae bacterium]